MATNALIIGYGNSLRSDDGVGPAIVQALASEPPLDCRIVVCHQLTPELAESIAGVNLVVFVDAAADIQPGAVIAHQIRETSKRPSGLMHTADPAALLSLARKLYGRSPKAFLVTVGVSSFALSEGLSQAVSSALPEAIATVRRLVSEGAVAGRTLDDE